MNLLTKQLVSAGSVILLGIAGLRPAGAQTTPPTGGAPVTVQNTSANPVPVTGAVTVQNTAANPVPITGSATVTGNVTITGNTLANPLIVRDISQPAVQPFQIVLSTRDTFNRYNVPPQSRLVIELVTSQCVNISLPSLVLVSTAGGTTANHYFAPSFLGMLSTNSVWQNNNLVRIYADPSTVVELDGSGAGVCLATLSGYLAPK